MPSADHVPPNPWQALLPGNSALEIVFSQDGPMIFSIPLVSLEGALDAPCL